MSQDVFLFDYFEPNELVYLLDEGDAAFRFVSVVPKTSKAGNPMLELTMDITDCKGKKGTVMEWLVATPGDEAGMKRLATKISNIAKAINKPELYAAKARISPNDLLGYSGKCYIKIQKGEGNNRDRNVVSRWLPHEDFLDAEKQKLAQEQIAILDDEIIPF